MTTWPTRIPNDLQNAWEAADHDAWRGPLQGWLNRHNLEVEIQDLFSRVSVLDQWRNRPSHQDRWSAVIDWMSRKNVSAPQNLPSPERREHHQLGH